LIPQKLRKQHC